MGIHGQDAAGLPISGDAEYWSKDYLPPMTNRLTNTEKKFGIRFGRIRWDCKFKDCLNLEFTDPEGVLVKINYDNFSRVIRSPAAIYLGKKEAEDSKNAEEGESTADSGEIPGGSEHRAAPNGGTRETVVSADDDFGAPGRVDGVPCRRPSVEAASSVRSTGSVRSTSDLRLQVLTHLENNQEE